LNPPFFSYGVQEFSIPGRTAIGSVKTFVPCNLS
jgi:hypothetical protein